MENNNNNFIKEHIQVGTSRNDTFNLYYERYGNESADIKIIFIAGLMSSGNNDYIKQVEYFMGLTNSNQYQIVLYDNRGSGKSGKTKNYSTSLMALDLLELINYLKWGSAHIVGASMGGMIALEFACNQCNVNRIRTLTLAVTHAGNTITPIKGLLGTVKSMFTNDIKKKSMIIIDMLYSKEYLLETSSSSSQSDTTQTNKQYLTKLFVDRQSSIDFKPPCVSAIIGQLKSVLTHYISKSRLVTLGNQKFPILILSATDDQLISTRNSHCLNKHLNPIQFTIFKNCGHAINIERLNEFNDILYNHINRYINK